MTTSPTLAPSATDGGATLLSWLREMRDNQPVWRDAYGVWHVFRYSDVHRAISEPDVFSSDIGRVVPAGQKLSAGNLVRTDPPRHHQLRRLVGAAFTTTALLGNTVLCLDKSAPKVLTELRADRSLIPAAIEEVLRYRSSFTQVGRVTMTEARLAGQTIPADAIVTPWLLSANRDEREFDDPDRFDIHRSANHHVAFGYGIHFCIGQLLARVEGRVAIGVLLDRYSEIRLNPRGTPGVLRPRDLRRQEHPHLHPPRLASPQPPKGHMDA